MPAFLQVKDSLFTISCTTARNNCLWFLLGIKNLGKMGIRTRSEYERQDDSRKTVPVLVNLRPLTIPKTASVSSQSTFDELFLRRILFRERRDGHQRADLFPASRGGVLNVHADCRAPQGRIMLRCVNH